MAEKERDWGGKPAELDMLTTLAPGLRILSLKDLQ